MEQIEYPTIVTCIRPARAAVAYPTNFDWMHDARQVIRSLNRVWGGAGGTLLPLTDSCEVPDILLPLLHHFDPDDVLLHPLTLRDVVVGAPERRAEQVARYRWETESDDETWARIADESIGYQQDCRSALAAQVDAWCSPLRMTIRDDGIFGKADIHTLARKGSPGGNLSLVPTRPADATVYDLDLSGVDPVVALMVESRVGALTDADRADLPTLTLPVLDEDVPGLISLAITGGVQWNWHLNERYQSITDDPNSELSEDIYLRNTPFARTRRELADTNMAAEPAPTVCVIGDTPADHALAVLCDRLFARGSWLPRQLLDAGSPHRDAVAIALYQLVSQFLPHSVIKITSTSVPVEELKSLVDGLKGGLAVLAGSWPPGGPELQFVDVNELYSEKGWSQLADKRWYSQLRRLPSREVAGERALLTPIEPTVPIAGADGELDWCVDVLVPNYQPPARTALGTNVFTQTTQTIKEAVTRASRHGVSFSSKNMGIVLAGSSLESRIAQPLLRLPSAEQIFSAIGAKGAANVHPSSAGRRAVNATELWGSFAAITADLQGNVRRLLDAFLPPPKNGNGDYGDGYAIRKHGYLHLQHAVAALQVSDEEARAVLDRLLGHKVLRRGLVLSCARCAAQSFYTIGSFTDDGFVCVMCASPNELNQARWYKGAAEPVWHYALDQVVHDLLGQHGDIPLLAAVQLSSGRHTMLWAPELQIHFDGGDEAELDIALIIDGQIVVGEAKSNDQLKTSDKSTEAAAKRLVRCAQMLTADKIVLATSRDSWTNGVKDAVIAAVKTDWKTGPQPSVHELTAVGRA